VAALSSNAEETSDVHVSSPELRIILYHTRPGSESLKMKRSSNIWNWREQIKTALTKKLKLLIEKLEGKMSVVEGGRGGR